MNQTNHSPATAEEVAQKIQGDLKAMFAKAAKSAQAAPAADAQAEQSLADSPPKQ